MFRIFLMALWISQSSWMLMGNKLDASLQTKKSYEAKDQVKDAVQAAVIAANEIEDITDEIKDAVEDTAKDLNFRAKDAIAAAVPAIRVSDTCTVKVCGKDNGYHIPHFEDPDWYDQYYRSFIRIHLNDHDNAAKYEAVPTWKNVEYCITIRQENEKTHVTSWWEKLPASRFYLVIIGYAEYDEDDDEDMEIAENKDACDGDIVMTWKYIIDMFQTGDDFVKQPVERTTLDDTPYTNDDSIVWYRKGKRKFSGKLMEHMSRWRARKAYWMLDGTLLEAAADVPSGYVDDNTFFPADALALYGSEGLGLDRFIFQRPYSLGLNDNVDYPKRNVNSFWDSLDNEDDFKTFKNQKKFMFDRDSSESKTVARFISNYVASTTTSPATLPAGVEMLKATRQNGVAPTTSCSDDCLITKSFCQSATASECCMVPCTPKVYSAEIQLDYLFQKVRYSDYSLKLGIVECGLFPKTLPKPKNCNSKSKSESEAGMF